MNYIAPINATTKSAHTKLYLLLPTDLLYE